MNLGCMHCYYAERGGDDNSMLRVRRGMHNLRKLLGVDEEDESGGKEKCTCRLDFKLVSSFFDVH
jgi:hypothetical protein